MFFITLIGVDVIFGFFCWIVLVSMYHVVAASASHLIVFLPEPQLISVLFYFMWHSIFIILSLLFLENKVFYFIECFFISFFGFFFLFYNKVYDYIYNWCQRKKTFYYKKHNLDKSRKDFISCQVKVTSTVKSRPRISMVQEKVSNFF